MLQANVNKNDSGNAIIRVTLNSIWFPCTYSIISSKLGAPIIINSNKENITAPTRDCIASEIIYLILASFFY